MNFPRFLQAHGIDPGLAADREERLRKAWSYSFNLNALMTRLSFESPTREDAYLYGFAMAVLLMESDADLTFENTGNPAGEQDEIIEA